MSGPRLHGAVPGTAPRLDPSGDEARSWLRRELLHPDYREDDVLQRVLGWLARQLDRGLSAAAQAPPLSTLAAMAIGLALVLALAWLLGRTRREPRAVRRPGAVVEDHTVPAAQWRARAQAALAGGRPTEALPDAFRALAVRQVEGGVLEDLPGATAHEVAVALGEAEPAHAAAVAEAAGFFDAVVYGHRPATTAQVETVLALDAALGGLPAAGTGRR